MQSTSQPIELHTNRCPRASSLRTLCVRMLHMRPRAASLGRACTRARRSHGSHSLRTVQTGRTPVAHSLLKRRHMQGRGIRGRSLPTARSVSRCHERVRAQHCVENHLPQPPGPAPTCWSAPTASAAAIATTAARMMERGRKEL